MQWWDSLTGKEIRQLTLEDGKDQPSLGRGFRDVQIAPDGKWLAIGRHSSDKPRTTLAQLYDLESGKELRQISRESDYRDPTARFSPDGKFLAWLGSNDQVLLYNTATGAEVAASAAKGPPDRGSGADERSVFRRTGKCC